MLIVGATFIQGGTSIPESRVPNKHWVFLTEWKTAYKEEELCYLFEKKSKVSDIQTIGKGININSVYTSFLILDPKVPIL